MDGNEDDAEPYKGEFKAKVALEAIRGDLTLADLSAKHGIHPTMIVTYSPEIMPLVS